MRTYKEDFKQIYQYIKNKLLQAVTIPFTDRESLMRVVIISPVSL